MQQDSILTSLFFYFWHVWQTLEIQKANVTRCTLFSGFSQSKHWGTNKPNLSRSKKKFNQKVCDDQVRENPMWPAALCFQTCHRVSIVPQNKPNLSESTTQDDQASENLMWPVALCFQASHREFRVSSVALFWKHLPWNGVQLCYETPRPCVSPKPFF